MKGAEYTGKAIHKGASKLREHMTPEDTPATVSPGVTKGLQVAKGATGGAVRVSQFLGEPAACVCVRVWERDERDESGRMYVYLQCVCVCVCV